jgi:chemotaxis protein CheZ
MPPVPAPAPFTDADYEMIAAAVLETERGRWFLAEHARRNRQADTKLVLEAIAKLERTLAHRPESPDPDRMRVDLVEMLNAITRTKAEIAAIRPSDAANNHFDRASTELDDIVGHDREGHVGYSRRRRARAGDRLDPARTGRRLRNLRSVDAHATEVYMACSFQDITGQRTRKVIEVLRFLEARIDAMIRIWRLDDLEFVPAGDKDLTAPQVRGPQETGDRLQQDAVDQLIGNERKPDVIWRESRIQESRDPRNLGEFDLEDLVVFESSLDTDAQLEHIEASQTGEPPDRSGPDVHPR